jgi:hypothetical protein
MERRYLALTSDVQQEYIQYGNVFMQFVSQIKDYMCALTETSDIYDACNVLAHILMCMPFEVLYNGCYSPSYAHRCYKLGVDKTEVSFTKSNDQHLDKIYAEYKTPLEKCCNDPVPLTDPVNQFAELTMQTHLKLVNGNNTETSQWYDSYDELYMETKNKEFNVIKKCILDNIMNYINAVVIAMA